MSYLALQKNLRDVVAEYDAKLAGIDAALAEFNQAGSNLMLACTIGGTFGDTRIDTGSVAEWRMREFLLKSAWKHIYSGLNIARLASPQDKKKWEQSLASPAPFTLDNIRATFGNYILDPRGNILRGLAEVFCNLDPAYKSHDKVRIGVKGLPKRIILSYVSDYGHGRDGIESILNAIASYQNKPLVTWNEVSDLLKDENALQESRGVTLKRFKNGNAHMHFDAVTLNDINMALAEYYGDALADDSNEAPVKATSTAVAKDLQYFPTPAAVVERVLDELPNISGWKILEPSCGCGRFLDALSRRGAHALGVEYHGGRAELAKAKGHKVLTANFLETVPTGDYDAVVMNPPFYGKHYAKHVEHALKFLKPRGVLKAVLPVTARYDHGLLDGRWEDLPVGSFSESGTNINTTIFTTWK